MKNYVVFAVIAVAALALYLGCGGSNNSNLITPDQDGGGLADTGGPGGDNTCAGTTCGTAQICNESKVCVNKPTEDAVAYVEKGAAIGAPDVSCLTTPPATPTTFDKVKVEACVDVFGLASNTVDLEVTYYLDGDRTTPIAGPITSVTNDRCKSSGFHTAENIPTNTLLVRRVACPSSMPDCGFHDSWQFNIYLDSATAEAGVITDLANDDAIANVISDATWSLIPRTVGISGGVPKGQGVVAGRIRDCKHNPVMNVMTGMTANAKMQTYFNGAEGTIDEQGNEKGSDPDVNRMSSNKDGLYAGIAMLPGPVTVSALGLVAGALQSFGTYKVEVIADAASILSFKGARPVAQK